MSKNHLKHIYLVPGMAASTNIFDYLKFPSDTYELHFLPWLLPLSKNESLENYAKRMAALITHPEPIILGVSFGGIMAQEISNHIPTKKVVIISSVKCRKELPKRLKLIQKTKIYKLFPSNSLKSIEEFSMLAFGNFAKKRVELYRQYLSVRDKDYLEWAIYNVLHWKRKSPIKNVLHIHGEADSVFPIKHIKNCHKIPNGSHVMILYKAKSISKIIRENLNC